MRNQRKDTGRDKTKYLVPTQSATACRPKPRNKVKKRVQTNKNWPQPEAKNTDTIMEGMLNDDCRGRWVTENPDHNRRAAHVQKQVKD